MHHLSRLYLDGFACLQGEDITPSRSQAFVWLSKAALHGHVIAQAQLAVWTAD